MSDDDLIRRRDAMSLYAPDNIFSAAQRKRIAALPAVTDTAAWNNAIQAAADAMLPEGDIAFRGSWYEPALKAARGRILALLKP